MSSRVKRHLGLVASLAGLAVAYSPLMHALGARPQLKPEPQQRAQPQRSPQGTREQARRQKQMTKRKRAP